MGYEVIIVSNIEKALDEAKEKKPELILLDGMLAKENDYNGFYQLRFEIILSNTPIIISTSKEELENFLQKKLEGVAGYCLKPFDYTDLLDRIRAALPRY